MDPKQYQEAIKRTDYGETNLIRLQNRLHEPETARMVHYSLGLAGESGEIVDHVKKCIRDGLKMDRVNLIEEVGDILWYCTNMLTVLGSTIEEAMQANIDKLSQRYPEGFTESAGPNREVVTERKVLEKSLKGDKY